MANSIFSAPRVVFGTHGIKPEHFTQGFQCGAADTATGYKNAVDVGNMAREYETKTGKRLHVSTKFNTLDFKDGIDVAIMRHRGELNYPVREIYLHSTLDTDDKNFAAIKKLREEFPNSRIGASNMTLRQLQALYQRGGRLDAFQLEYRITFRPDRVREFCQQHGITMYGYSSLKDVRNEVVLAVAKSRDQSPAHLIFDWLAHKNVIPITASEKPANIADSAIWLPKPLSVDEVKQLDAVYSDPEGKCAGSVYMEKWTGRGMPGEPFVV